MPPPPGGSSRPGSGKPGGGPPTKKASSRPAAPSSKSPPSGGGTKAKTGGGGGKGAGASKIKIDVKKVLEDGYLKAPYLRARADAWNAQARSHDKAARAKMGLAAKLGQSINRLMEEKGISQAPQLFKMWDLDGNGLLDRDEWRKACKELKLDGATDEGVDALYSELDSDGSGEIDLNELVEALRLLREKVAKAMNDLATVVTDVDGLQACAHVAVRAAEAAEEVDKAEAELGKLEADAPNKKELQMKLEDAKKFALSKQSELREMEEETREELEATRQARAAKAARDTKAAAAEAALAKAEADKAAAGAAAGAAVEKPNEPKVDLW